jgi:hypothetical protein
MDTTLTAIETTATVDENRQIHLDTPLPIAGPLRVKLIVLYPLTEDIDEATWLYAASRNPAFASLHDASEDIYTIQDGKPFDAEA